MNSTIMGITEIQQDLASSLKRGDTTRVESLRLILSQLHNDAIAQYGNQADAKVNDADVVAVLRKLAKRHHESIVAFTKGSRDDLVAKEKAQLSVVESYLPRELTESEIGDILNPLLVASEDKNFGSLMAAAMEKVRGQADGGRVAAILKEKLNVKNNK